MTVSRTGLLVVVLVAAALAGGCGDSSGNRQAMEVKFERIDFQFSTLETANAAFNARHLARETQRYIGLVHQYEDVLGREEAKRRLNQKADELSSYCLPCSGVLADEARNF
jgi:uncharacterized protein HemX